jgi:hypothetical protein
MTPISSKRPAINDRKWLMRSMLAVIFAASAMFFAQTARANQIVTFNLQGVTFEDAGTATGSFTFDETTFNVTDWNLTATDPNYIDTPEVFDPFNSYGSTVNCDSNPTCNGLSFYNPDTNDTLYLGFTADLTTISVDLLTSCPGGCSSYYYGWATNNGPPFNQDTAIASGQVDPVPEPSGLAVLGAGLAVMLLAHRRGWSAVHADPLLGPVVNWT